ncbi:hypothetical protein JW926_03610 [Candidatus Sumerlaeota bacterium]|nr:hypothetical protein [Candidatus Sumerlaeota bacterium]
MGRLKIDKYFIAKLAFWLWALLFAWFYIRSDGFDAFLRIKFIPWMKQAAGIAFKKPESVATLDWHARQALLNRFKFSELTVEDNRRYFSQWDQDYLQFQLKAVQDLLEAREKPDKTSDTLKTLRFIDLYHSGKLTISGAEINENNRSISLKPASNSCRMELILPFPITCLSYYKVSIFGGLKRLTENPKTPFANYIRLFWKSNRYPGYSGERSAPLDLDPLTNQPYIETDMSHDILWLQGSKLNALLLMFHLSEDSEIELQKIEFHRSISENTVDKYRTFSRTLE